MGWENLFYMFSSFFTQNKAAKALHFTTALEQDKFLNFDSPWNHQNLILEASFGDNPLFLDRLSCRIRPIFVPVF